MTIRGWSRSHSRHLRRSRFGETTGIRRLVFSVKKATERGTKRVRGNRGRPLWKGPPSLYTCPNSISDCRNLLRTFLPCPYGKVMWLCTVSDSKFHTEDT
jgi:hypothetical protein